MKFNTLIAAAILLTATTSAFAAKDEGFYLGAQANNTAVEDNIGEFDNKTFGYGAYAGYNFNDKFGLEATVFATNSFLDDADFRMSGFTLSPVVRHDFADWLTVYLKAGLIVNNTYSNDEGNDEDYRGTGWLFGGGFDLNFTDSLALRLFYEYSQTEPAYSGLENYFADIFIDQYGVGLHYKF